MDATYTMAQKVKLQLTSWYYYCIGLVFGTGDFAANATRSCAFQRRSSQRRASQRSIGPARVSVKSSGGYQVITLLEPSSKPASSSCSTDRFRVCSSRHCDPFLKPKAEVQQPATTWQLVNRASKVVKDSSQKRLGLSRDKDAKVPAPAPKSRTISSLNFAFEEKYNNKDKSREKPRDKDSNQDKSHDKPKVREFELQKMHEKSKDKDSNQDKSHDKPKVREFELQKIHEKSKDKDSNLDKSHDKSKVREFELQKIHEKSKDKDCDQGKIHEKSKDKDSSKHRSLGKSKDKDSSKHRSHGKSKDKDCSQEDQCRDKPIEKDLIKDMCGVKPIGKHWGTDVCRVNPTETEGNKDMCRVEVADFALKDCDKVKSRETGLDKLRDRYTSTSREKLKDKDCDKDGSIKRVAIALTTENALRSRQTNKGARVIGDRCNKDHFMDSLDSAEVPPRRHRRQVRQNDWLMVQAADETAVKIRPSMS